MRIQTSELRNGRKNKDIKAGEQISSITNNSIIIGLVDQFNTFVSFTKPQFYAHMETMEEKLASLRANEVNL